MIENEITLIIGGEMNGTVGTSGQLAGATSWQLRRATSRLGSSSRVCSLEHVGGRVPINTQDILLCEFWDKPL